MSPLLFDVCMDGVVREVNVRMLGKGLEMLSVKGGRFDINRQLFADNRALVADSEEKLCRKAKKCLYEGVIVPTVVCGAEAWGIRSAKRRKVNVLEMKYLRS